MSPPTFQDFRDHVLKKTRDNSPPRPGLDWPGVFLMDTGADGLKIVPTVDLQHTEDGWERALTRLLPGMIVQHQARFYALISMSWATTLVSPGREVVSVRCASAIEQEAWTADVTRPPGEPPELGDWEKLEVVQAQGSDSLRAALIAARSRN